MLNVKKLLTMILSELLAERTTVKTGGTTWKYKIYPNGWIDAIGVTDEFTTTHYAAITGLYGYYADVNLPVKMKNVDYYCNAKWKISTGFAWNAGTIGQQTGSLRSYALASYSGSQACKIIMHLCGETA